MRKTLFVLTFLAFLPPRPAAAEMSAAEYFARDKSSNWTGPLVNDVYTPYGKLPKTYVPSDRQYVARIVERLKATPEGKGTMFDNTMVMYFPESGETHHSLGTEAPFVVLAGDNITSAGVLDVAPRPYAVSVTPDGRTATPVITRPNRPLGDRSA